MARQKDLTSFGSSIVCGSKIMRPGPRSNPDEFPERRIPLEVQPSQNAGSRRALVHLRNREWNPPFQERVTAVDLGERSPRVLARSGLKKEETGERRFLDHHDHSLPCAHQYHIPLACFR